MSSGLDRERGLRTRRGMCPWSGPPFSAASIKGAPSGEGEEVPRAEALGQGSPGLEGGD